MRAASVASAVPLVALLLLAWQPCTTNAARVDSATFAKISKAVRDGRNKDTLDSVDDVDTEALRLARVAQMKASGASKGYTDAALSDLVTHMPGWGNINEFNMFAGYVTVNDDAGRALFYIFAEAPQAPAAAAGAENKELPLLLWLNGGPGCSSIGGGFMSELGPFFPTQDGRGLQPNPYPWNSFANVLWIESPAFVGFSYSNTTRDAVVGDARTAADLRVFLLRFLQRFPKYADTPFYISGESYAGHYVPHLAAAIVDGNRQGGGDAKINLQGFLVGNPWTDAAIDNLGAVDYWWSHALISDQTATGIRANCNFSRIGPLDPHPAHASSVTRDELCDDFCNRAFDELGEINIYEIYADLCTQPRALRKQAEALHWALAGGNTEQEQQEEGRRSGPRHPALAASAAAAATARRRAAPAAAAAAAASGTGAVAVSASGDGADPGYDPCVDDEVEIYLNLPEVQRALHANQTVKLPWRWTDCSRNIAYSREDLLSSMLHVYEKLIQAGLRMLVYSGDVDGIVPVVGTRRWVASLRLKEKAAWRPWKTGGQVGGYTVEYVGLQFATVRGAGHMVPYVQPARAAHMARNFLEGRPL